MHTNIRSTSSYQAAKWLQLNTGINYTQTQNHTGNNPGYDYYSIVQTKRYLPYTKLADAHGNPLPVYEDYSKEFIDAASSSGDVLDWTYKPLADINQQVNTVKTIDYVVYAGWNVQITKALHIDFAKRWQKPGDEKHTHIPSLIYPANYYRDYFYAYSNVLVANAANIRLEDISLSYNLSRQTLKRLPAQSIRLFIYASNLGVLWLKNTYKIDPYYNNIARDAKEIAIGFNIIF